SVRQAGVPGMLLGAGTGTAQIDFLSYIQSYVTLPVDFIDMHIYPINRSYLPNALQIASTAAAAGKPVTMTECWLWKVRDSEVHVLSIDQIRARNPFSFWAPLDAYFLQTMQNLAQNTQMLFMTPDATTYFEAYLPYDSSIQNLTPGPMLQMENAQASQNLGAAIFTSTAMSYYTSLVAPPDTIPPAVPTGLAGHSANPSTAMVSWNASTDNVGVAGYYLLRNGSVAGATAGLNFQDTGLTEAATYTYTVESFDLGGNVSAPSLPISVTTEDVAPPTAPGSLAGTATSSGKVILTWSPATDNTGINYYLVFSGISPGALAQAGRVPSSVTGFTSSPLTAGTTYYYGVEAVDTSGNTSMMSSIVAVTTPMPPSAPANFTATPVSTAKVAMTWSAAVSGGLPIQKYYVYRGSSAFSLSQIAVVTQTAYTDSSANPATTTYYAVAAADTGGDLSTMSAIVAAKTPSQPAAPANLAATAASTGKVGVTWSAALSGGLAIQNYHVYRGNAATSLIQVAVVLQTSYNDTTVIAGTTYYYAVAAADSGADLSPMSAIVAVTVPTPPSAPMKLSAAPVSTTKISLTWSASVSGGLPIQYYHVFRGGSASNLSQVGNASQAAYTDNSLPPSTTYYYAVQALDTGGDLSAMSATVAATTLALPSAPANLTAAAVSKAQINLSWTPGSSGLPPAWFSVYRGSSPSSLTPLRTVAATTTSINDRTVAAGATYYYAVQEKDTGGNVSPMSAAVSVTTPN
ncbi:MAG TPA: fibronectin type III domain-containing protein, partial [Bryobacteraceae bacterium]|nr:fibronectin type III domain-containing protein [Bryobacteraceae bacterium]